MAAKIAAEEIMELRNALKFPGVNIAGPAYMFADNQTVVDSSSTPQSRLHKQHVLLSFH